MVKLLVDFIGTSNVVKDIRWYTNDDLNQCFKRILEDMEEVACKVVRISIWKDERWADIDTFSQDRLRGMIDDGMCG